MGVTSAAFRRVVAAGCLCAILFPRSALAQSSLPLKVLSYNLHHGEGTDGKLDLARIGRIIASVAPAYAGLQEVDSATSRTGRVDQAAEYARLTGLRYAFSRAIAFEGGAYGNTVLSRFPLGRVQRIALPGAEPRAAMIIDIDLSEGRDPARSTVTFINTHLMVGSGAEADRLESARRINAFASDPARGDTGRPMILLGDMNATRGSGAIREFQKAWQAADFDYGIDWVFFRPAGRWRFLRAVKLDEGDAAVASDHLPVAQEMELLLPPASSLQPLPRPRLLAPNTPPAALVLRAGPAASLLEGVLPVDGLGRIPPLPRRF